MAPLVRRLGLKEGTEGEREEMQAREQAAAAALSRLSELTEEDWPKRDHLERLRLHYGRRRQRFPPSADVDPECRKETGEAFLRLRQETLTAERLALIRLRDEGTISDEVLQSPSPHYS
ncbi:MAG TPA: hypothetical protein VLA99_01535 [Nitrospiraceae bacterium]|nr:hypothetical protein [Nitrospiraceae bacterium]